VPARRLAHGALAALLAGFAASPAAGDAASDALWQQTIAAARKEGSVVVSGPPGSLQRSAIVKGWAKAHPDIRLDYSGGRGSAVISKIVRERTAGLYHWDIILASTNSVVANLLPIQALAPLREALIKPDIADDRTWIAGFEIGFMDRDKKFLYSAMGRGAEPLGYVNRACLSEEIFAKTADMKKPELKGKIAWYDPTRSGIGSRNAWVLVQYLGEDWLKDLFLDHDVTFSRDYRQMTDWLVGCVKPVSFGMPYDTIDQMRQAGIGDKVAEMVGKAYSGGVNPGGPGGNESIGWFNKAPHPNAAKIFVNWFLSQEFQEEHAALVSDNSRRIDTRPGNPNPQRIMQPGVTYQVWANEEATENVTRLQKKIATWGLEQR
jgi:iron(III) transport system substrate-binding protein